MSFDLSPGDILYHNVKGDLAYLWMHIVVAKEGERVELLTLHVGQGVLPWTDTCNAPVSAFFNGTYTILRRPR